MLLLCYGCATVPPPKEASSGVVYEITDIELYGTVKPGTVPNYFCFIDVPKKTLQCLYYPEFLELSRKRNERPSLPQL